MRKGSYRGFEEEDSIPACSDGWERSKKGVENITFNSFVIIVFLLLTYYRLGL